MPAEERRAAIIDTAVRLFSEKGFRGTTTRELAAEVGVSEPVLYQHFANKDDLYRAIIENLCDEQSKVQDARMLAAEAAEDDVAFFTRLAELILEWHDVQKNIARLLLFSALERHPLSKVFCQQLVANARDAVSAYIRKRQEKGQFRNICPDTAARAFMGMVIHQGLVFTVFEMEDTVRVEKELVAGLVDVFLNGIRPTRTRA